MAHQYSVEIQDFLGQLIADAEEQLKAAPKGSEEAARAAGKLEEAQFFRQHLSDNYDLKTQKYY